VNHSKGICVIGWVHVKDRKSGTSAKPELDFNLGEDFEIVFICEILKVLLKSLSRFKVL
jgi:hypothetical protein